MRHFHPLRVRELRQETDDCVSICFEVPSDLTETFSFIQGQYLTLRATIEGEDVRRSYSICSGVDDGELRVAVKKVAGGRFSTFANEVLTEGEFLDVMPPMGRFYTALHPEQARRHVAFAAGSGITPVMSLIKTTLHREPESTFTLFYVNKDSMSIIFKSALEDLKDRYLSRFRMFHILTREPGDLEMLSGRLDEARCTEVCRTFIDVLDADAFFICGPEPMIHAVRGSLEKMGVAPDNVHFELFTAAAPAPSRADEHPAGQAERQEGHGTKAKVEVILDGNRMEFDLDYSGKNVLDAALERGADLPFSCKGGVCCTCRALLVEGEVHMDVNYSLEPDELERGYILTCQAHPRTERIVVDFDQQ
jgi:ring-1,2-phenylacetyl-CoA epoxidase subunit PaaE